jgi:hypothetical protein
MPGGSLKAEAVVAAWWTVVAGAAGLAGVWADAATVPATRSKIKAVCFIACCSSKEFLTGVYQVVWRALAFFVKYRRLPQDKGGLAAAPYMSLCAGT